MTRVLVFALLVCLSAPSAFAQDDLESLSLAAANHPQEPEVWLRLSQAYSAAGQPGPALAAIERGLALRPLDPRFVESAAVLSTWTGNYKQARRHYLTLLTLDPHDAAALVALARIESWMGETDDAVRTLRRYLRQRDGDASAWLDLANTELWRGNAAGALEALDRCGRDGESSVRAQLIAARAYAAAGRGEQALQVIPPPSGDVDTQRENHLVRALAFATLGRLSAMRRELDEARRVGGEHESLYETERFVRTTAGSRFETYTNSYTDSDRLRIATVGWAANWALQGDTRLAFGFERQRLAAPVRSGLATLDGDPVPRETGWIDVGRAVGKAKASGRLGFDRAGERTAAHYRIGVLLRPSDVISAGLETGRGALALSPKTVEQQWRAQTTRLDLEWSPGLTTRVAGGVTMQSISDGNVRWQFALAPRTALARREKVNLDIGAFALVLRTARDVSHGYWDPARYESYGARVHPYFKLSENTGLGGVVSFGVQRELNRPFRPGVDVSVDATLGIYRSWTVKAAASGTSNGRLESGAFRGAHGSLSLIRRF